MRKHFITFGLTILLAGCCVFSSPKTCVNPCNICDLEQLCQASTRPNGSPELSQIRVKALQDIGMSLGAQAGLATASAEINCHLQKDAKYLGSIYNFDAMMLSHGVIPPVLAEGDNTLNLDDPTTIRIADRTYKIIHQARFATTPPNWHDYLWQSYAKPELPARFLLPRTNEERAIWSRAVRLGWEKGTQQAHDIFQQNLALLKRDYKGMILYRKLLQEHMVSPPFVMKTNLGVTGCGEDMRINDQVLRITELPKLQTDSSNWRAIVVKDDDGN